MSFLITTVHASYYSIDDLRPDMRGDNIYFEMTYCQHFGDGVWIAAKQTAFIIIRYDNVEPDD